MGHVMIINLDFATGLARETSLHPIIIKEWNWPQIPSKMKSFHLPLWAMGESLNQLLIVDRNAEAMRGLQKQIVAGRKKIGIFYGAAHLPDMEKHLIRDFGFVRSDIDWLPAWDLIRAKPTQLSEPASLMLNLLKILE